MGHRTTNCIKLLCDAGAIHIVLLSNAEKISGLFEIENIKTQLFEYQGGFLWDEFVIFGVSYFLA